VKKNVTPHVRVIWVELGTPDALIFKQSDRPPFVLADRAIPAAQLAAILAVAEALGGAA
jgi:hypothetical protein